MPRHAACGERQRGAPCPGRPLASAFTACAESTLSDAGAARLAEMPNSKGNVSVAVDMTRDTTVTAVFTGDARYAPRTVKSTAYAHAKISTALSKHYKTGKIGSTTYHYYRKNTAPVFTTTMNYHPGRKQRLDVQVYYQGSWYDSASEYFALATNGRSAVNLGAPGESGIRARIRSAYINGSSGDAVNSTTYGAWKYLIFTN